MYKKLSTKIIIILVTAGILTVPSSVLQVSHAQSNADLQNTVLEIVNRERAAVGVPPLVWSDTLAAGTQTWADHQAGLAKVSTRLETSKIMPRPLHIGDPLAGR